TQLVRVHKPTSCMVSTLAQPRSGEVLLPQKGPGNCNNTTNCSENEESSSGVGNGQQGRQKPGRQHFDGAAAAAAAMAAPRSDSFLFSTAAETGKTTTNDEDRRRFLGLFPRGRHPSSSLPKGRRPGGGVAGKNNTTSALGGGAGSRRSRGGAAFLAAEYAIGRVSHGTRRLVGHPVDMARLDFKLSSRRQEMAARREEERLGARKRQRQRRQWLSVLCTVVPLIALAEKLGAADAAVKTTKATNHGA
ncbi:unnamed protein product, partial [Ectocarpus sp. 12 AP-2014]